MRFSIAGILGALARKIRILRILPRYRKYISGIGPTHPLRGIRTRIVGDASANPTEYFDHYDAFAFWIARHLRSRGGGLRILDVGSPKMMNGVFSAMHEVHALVLADCSDRISEVTYHKHDVSLPLPFGESSFDVFTSTVSMPLIGLGRYGDALDPDCMVNLIFELGRVMKPDADLFVSMCLGQNILNFNNGWFFDFPTLNRIFLGYDVVEHLVDQESSPYGTNSPDSCRFSESTSVEAYRPGDYRIIFLHLRKSTTPPS